MQPIQIKRREACHTTQNWHDTPPLLQRLYAHRGLSSVDDIDYALKGLLPYKELKNTEQACEFLYEHLSKQSKVLIMGDYDADGATSSALAVKALRAMGFEHVNFLVPNRFDYGYGLSEALVDLAHEQSPDLLITVDNGITSHAGVKRAHELGMQVMITDHHLSHDSLPDADVIINPNQPGDMFQSKHLAGVGVIFYVMLAFRAHLRDRKWFAEKSIEPPNFLALLDLVALGTVADVVSLDKNNRLLVHHGLELIRQGHASPGVQALLNMAKKKPASVNASDLGFYLGPRLNAAGRLDDMSTGIRCLLSDNLNEALALADKLDTLNQERKHIEQKMRGEADRALSLMNKQFDEPPAGLCLFDATWHEGVIGILAGRLKEQHHRPTIVFAKAGNGTLKGSARSIKGLNIRDLIADLNGSEPDLIHQFGGHAMAAGLAIDQCNFERFKQRFVAACKQHLTPEMLTRCLWSDGPLQRHELQINSAQLLQKAGPWGQNFPEPLFDNRFFVMDARIIKGAHLKMQVTLVKGDTCMNAMMFNAKSWIEQPLRDKYMTMVYQLSVSDYWGAPELNLYVQHMSEVGGDGF